MTTLPVNQATVIFNGIINALFEGGEAAAEAYIEAQLPFLDMPVIKDVFQMFISWLGNAAATDVKTVVDFLVLNFQNQGQDSAVYQAMNQIQNSPGGTDAAQQAWQNIIGNWSVATPDAGT